MSVARDTDDAPWLLLTFTLPTKRASQRVEVWRKLQRYGAVPLGNSGYLLPTNPSNRERFEWLAQMIRKHAGEASVVSVQSIDNLSTPQLVARFAEARSREYEELIRDVQKLSSVALQKRGPGRLSRLRERFREIVEIDFSESLSQTAESPWSAFLQSDGRKLLHIADEFFVLPASRFGEARHKLGSGKIVDRLNADDRSFAGVFTYHLSQPLKPFPVGRIGGKEITGVAERHCSIALQFSPDFHPLTGPLCRQGECQQQPWRVIGIASYRHFICMLYL